MLVQELSKEEINIDTREEAIIISSQVYSIKPKKPRSYVIIAVAKSTQIPTQPWTKVSY